MTSKPMTVPEKDLNQPHPGHENHLCELTAKRNMQAVAEAAKDAQYICHICGRAAKEAKNLCEPVKL